MIKTVKITRGEIIWNSIIFLAITATALEAPYSYTFKTSIESGQLLMDGIISLLFACDGAYNVYQRIRKKLDFKSTKDKLSWWSLILTDMMAATPFDIISYTIADPQGTMALKLFKFLRLLRLIHIFRIIGDLTIVSRSLRMIIYGTSFLIFANIVSCCWTLINPPADGDNVTNYIKSLYWTITTLTTIGYGDITPTTNAGRLFTMMIMICGAGFYGVVIGNVTKVINDGEKHKEKAREKMTDLVTFMKYYNIPERLQQNVYAYYQHLLNKRLTDNDNKIIGELPQALQQELQIFMNMKLVRGLPIFKNCSTGCLKEVASALEQKYYGPGQTIINIGEIGDEMFIIGHGIVEVILKDGNAVATLHEGQFFGEAALLRETKRNANVRAQSYCDLYRLSKEDFLAIIEKHPDLKENMENSTFRRSSDRERRPNAA